jgi:uncharacterized protein YndB with AHSA1/START domain
MMAATRLTVVPGTPQLLIEREFNAPRHLVFRAHVDPELLKQWLGPRNLEMTVECLEACDGGRWRFVHRDADGNEFGFRGFFHGDPTPDQIVQTWEWEGMPGHVSLQTLTLEDRGGRTLLRANAVYQSVEDRDGHLANGMEEGMNEGYDRLEELLASRAVAR